MDDLCGDSSLERGALELHNFMGTEGICREEELKAFREKLGEFRNETAIVDSGRIIREYREMFIGGLSELQIRAFQCVHECIDTVNFIRELGGEFDKKTELATNLHTEKFESTLITNLVNVRNFTAFILEARENSSVKEFCAEAGNAAQEGVQGRDQGDIPERGG